MLRRYLACNVVKPEQHVDFPPREAGAVVVLPCRDFLLADGPLQAAEHLPQHLPTGWTAHLQALVHGAGVCAVALQVGAQAGPIGLGC